MPKNSLGGGEIIITNTESLRDKIYTIRGQKVMLDYDLAGIYGYTTSAFNQQVMRNIEKFDEDFMFRLNEQEFSNLMSHFVTSSWGGYRKLPYAFTEQGIYMLMTVLKGDLAIRQSKALIRLFKQLKDYALETRETLEYRDNLELAAKILETQKDVETAKSQITQLSETTKKTDAKVNEITKLMSDVVKRSELSPLVMDFTKLPERNEFLIMNGELARANETYIDIYARATKSIYIVDDYIDIKTLRQLQKVKNGVKIVVFSDNVSHYLHKRDYNEFIKEFPDIKVKFIKSGREFHDRFIILDDNTSNVKVFHCGASSKDAGASITMIMELSNDKTNELIREVVRKMVKNEKLELK